jgi:hypothetical protein
MKISTLKINLLLLFKLPAAYFTGVRTRHLDPKQCVVTVKFRWINQNPFKSMYWAVQGMAAELATGALVIAKIKEGGHNISMLLVHNSGSFLKKATGRITFTCNDGILVDKAIAKALVTSQGESILMNATGINADGIEVSKFSFEWTIKVKN